MPVRERSVTALLPALVRKQISAGGADAGTVAAWVRLAALDGLPPAQLCYGRMLLEGACVPKDQAAALGWFRRAAASGDLEAINMVGRCLDNGWGTAEDPGAAAVFFKHAADVGHPWAQYNLAHLYLDGRGVARSFEMAYLYYRLAAEQQHERAMNLMGRCCEQGWGTPKDPAAAATWYQRSAQRGYFRGQYNWATVLLSAGRDEEAAGWLLRAATGGPPSMRDAITALAGRTPHVAALQTLAGRLQNMDPATAPRLR